MTKLAVLVVIKAMAMTTFYFCFSITAAIPFCVNIAVTATIRTAVNIDLSEIYDTKGIRQNAIVTMKLIHIKMQNIIAKRKTHIQLLPIQMPSGQITTTTVCCCNNTFVAIRPVVPNQEQAIQLQRAHFCCINNVESNAMSLSLQILPCIQFMSFYAPNTNRSEIA